MSVYVLRWNPDISSYTRDEHEEMLENVRAGRQPVDFCWSIHDWENLRKDDWFVLQQVGTKCDGIAMIGKFQGPCFEDESWRDDGTMMHYANLWVMSCFDCYRGTVLPAKKYECVFPQIEWHHGHSGIRLEEGLGQSLMDEIEKDLIELGVWTESSLTEFAAYEGPVLVSGRPSAEDLADGRILLSLKNAYLDTENQENFVQLACCLRDSVLCMPLHVRFRDKDGNVHEPECQVPEPDVEEDCETIPLVLQNEDGEEAFVILSNKGQAGDSVDEKLFGSYNVAFETCVDMALSLMEKPLLVLDPFTRPFVINRELMELIIGLRYKDETDSEE